MVVLPDGQCIDSQFSVLHIARQENQDPVVPILQAEKQKQKCHTKMI